MKLNRSEFKKLLEEILKIKPVSVKEDSDNLLGFFTPSDRTIHIKKDLSDKDYIFVLSHEMRHVYQEEKGLIKENYKKRNETTLSDYNTQENEIDANGFAYVILSTVLGIKPLFEGLDDETRAKIKTRALEIAKELNRVNDQEKEKRARNER